MCQIRLFQDDRLMMKKMMFQNCNKNSAKNVTKMEHVDGRPILLQKGRKKVTKTAHIDGCPKL